MRLLSKLIVCISLNIFLVGCSAVKGDPAINQIDTAVDNGIKGNKAIENEHKSILMTDMLLPELSLPNEESANNQRFDVSVNNMSAKTFFSGLVSDTKYSIVVSPDVSQSISLSLKNVTIPEVLSTTASLYDLEFKKTQYGYEVFPAGIETRIFKINYLDIVRKGESRTMVNSGSLSTNPMLQNGGIGNGNTRFGGGFGGGFGGNNGGFAGNGTGNNNNNLANGAANGLQLSTSVISQSESNFWEELDESLDLFIGEKDSKDVVINPQSGTVVVRTTKSKADQIAKYIDSLQNTMNRQVILEAKIMEVTLNDGYQAGIDWNIFGVNQNLNQAFDSAEGVVDAAAKNLLNLFSVSATWGGADTFSTVIRLLSTQGNVQVLSSPRIATMNNQKAIMKIGTDSFFITGVDNTLVGDVTTNSVQSVNLQPFFSGLALSVTPQIAQQNDIILHIHPIISEVEQKILKYKIGANADEQQLPTASSKIKESDNIVRAKNGQMIVIAGLMGTSTKETIASVPFLGKIPYFGAIFRSTKQESVRTEMVILLRPVIIINGKEWTEDMERMQKRYKELNQGFHFGTHMDRFGTEGEFEYTE
jgi:MSHA biogenesis protein MshL